MLVALIHYPFQINVFGCGSTALSPRWLNFLRFFAANKILFSCL